MSTTLLQLQFKKFMDDSEDLLDHAKEGLKEYHTLIEYDQWAQMEEEEYNGLLLDYMLEYDGEERDLIWWAGRLKLSDEIDKSMTTYVLPEGPPDIEDTIGRDELDMLMNDITRRYFGYILVNCPECSCILQQYDDMPIIAEGEVMIPCPVCKDKCIGSECPDLFFLPKS